MAVLPIMLHCQYSSDAAWLTQSDLSRKRWCNVKRISVEDLTCFWVNGKVRALTPIVRRMMENPYAYGTPTPSNPEFNTCRIRYS